MQIKPAFSKTFVFAVLAMRFGKLPLWESFWKTSIFSGVFTVLGVDGRRKHIEKDTFSNENPLVWTGPETGVLDL